MTDTSAHELLAGVQTLRRRARHDRRAFAFPLFLFSALILFAPLCYADAPLEFNATPDGTLVPTFPLDGEGPFPIFLGFWPFWVVKYPDLISWYWFLTIIVGFAATAWWYRRRAYRIGVETDTRAYLMTAGAALTGFLIGAPLLKFLVPARHTLYSTPAINLPILIGSTAASAAALFWSTRARGEAGRAAGLFAGVLLATISFAALGVYMIRGFAALLIIAAGLLALAWLERSVLLGITALAFGGAALLANLYDIQNLLYRLGWSPETLQPLVLQSLLLPAAVLLVGGTVAATR